LHAECDKIHAKYDNIVHSMMKSMFSGRCGMRVNANGMHNVIKTMRNVIKRTHLDKVYVLTETWYEGEVKLQHKVIQYVRNAHFDRYMSCVTGIFVQMLKKK
jgi:hypothetical protein